MKIVCVFLNPAIRTGGHRRYLELADDLSRLGHEVVLIRGDGLDFPTGRARLITLPPEPRKRPLPFSLRAALAIARARRRVAAEAAEADWVMIHGESHFLAGLLIKRLLRAKLAFAYRSNAVAEALMSLRESSGRGLARARIRFEMLKFQAYERFIAARSDLLVFQSRFDEQDYLSRVPAAAGKTAVIRGNIGGPRFRADCRDINRSTRLRRLVFVGNFGRRKGLRYLMDAVVELLGAGREVALDVIAWGPALPKWQERVERLGMNGRIRLLGRRVDPLPLIGDADLMVVPSLFDSYPDVILEALHTGTPVIGSRVGGIPDMLGHDELLFEPMSSQAIRDRVAAMLDAPALYLRARELCRARADAFRFDWGAAFADAMRSARGAP